MGINCSLADLTLLEPQIKITDHLYGALYNGAGILASKCEVITDILKIYIQPLILMHQCSAQTCSFGVDKQLAAAEVLI